MNIQKGHLFPADSAIRGKLRRIYSYLFEGFPFQIDIFDYEGYWDRLSHENLPHMSDYKMSLIASLIDEGSSVLDLGCGNGELLQHLETTRNIQAHGIDVSQSAVDLTRKRGIQAEQADITGDKFQLTTSYDFIIASEVLEHLVKPEELILKVKDRFKKRLIVTVPNTGFLGERLRLLLGRFPKQWMLHPSEHLRFWTVTDFVFWCRQLELEVEHYYGIHDEYYDIKVKLWKFYPKLFSRYIIYEIRKG